METKTRCIFTNGQAIQENQVRDGMLLFRSRACGEYLITNGFMASRSMIKGDAKEAITQGDINCAKRSLELHEQGLVAVWCSKAESEQLTKNRFDLASTYVPCIYDAFYFEPSDHSEKPYRLLERIAKKLRNSLAFSLFRISSRDQISAGICDISELLELMTFLRSKNLLQFSGDASMLRITENNGELSIDCRMTVDGWRVVRENASFPFSNKVFIATQFKWDGEIALWTESMEAIKRACSVFGYEATTVDQNHTGNITDRIISDIRQSRFVVAELSYNNRGVYFESGFARGLGRQVFHVLREGHTSGEDSSGTRVHFDIQQVMYRTWREPLDLEQTLKDWIGATMGSFDKPGK